MGNCCSNYDQNEEVENVEGWSNFDLRAFYLAKKSNAVNKGFSIFKDLNSLIPLATSTYTSTLHQDHILSIKMYSLTLLV